MRKWESAILLLSVVPMIQACQRRPSADDLNAYAADDQNEDDALNQIRENAQEAAGAGQAVAGMVPDKNGRLPMANVQ